MGGAGEAGRQRCGVGEGRVGATAQRVARDGPSSAAATSFTPLPPVPASSPAHPLAASVPAVQARLRAKAWLLAGLEERGGGGGGVPSAAHTLPSAQLEDEVQEDQKEEVEEGGRDNEESGRGRGKRRRREKKREMEGLTGEKS